jgi:hypothetical protein
LLAELSSGRSWNWDSHDIEDHGFKLADEERIGILHFIKEAGAREGALISASTKNILVADNPVHAVRNFHSATQDFFEEGGKGLLIFVIDAGIFDAGEDRFSLLYNLGHLTTAVTAFALFQHALEETHTVQLYSVDWSRWQALTGRCCVVMRRPPLVHPDTGELLAREAFDDFVSDWMPRRRFDRLRDIEPVISFDSSHVLPRTYPAELDMHEALSGKDLHWNVTVRPCAEEPDELKVEFFISPAQPVAPTLASENSEVSEIANGKRNKRGRPQELTRAIEGDSFFMIRRPTPGRAYEDAQRAIYMAARARLFLDTGQEHQRNLVAAAALRYLGYEVLPLSVAVALLPRALYFAAENPQLEEKKH